MEFYDETKRYLITECMLTVAVIFGTSQAGVITECALGSSVTL